MVFLKRKWVVLLGVFCILTLSSQDITPLQKAFNESFILENEKEFDEAAKVLVKQYNPFNYETNLRIGWLYYKAGDYKASEKYYSAAINLMPYAIEPKLGATLPKSELNDWDAVLQLYQAILKIDTKNNTALYNAGLIYYNRGNFGEAYPLFKELNNLYPTDYSALLMHGWSALKIEKTREAKVLFNSLLLLYPNDASAKEALGILK